LERARQPRLCFRVDLCEGDLRVLCGHRFVEGANARQGPHHEAHQSIKTVPLPIFSAKFAAVISSVFIFLLRSGGSQGAAKGFRVIFLEPFAVSWLSRRKR
jgi:hypothetical protein